MNKESKRVLFSYWDGGTGHLTRTMSIAKEARERGVEVGFISSQKYANWISEENPDYIVYSVQNRNPAAQPPPYPFPVYSHAFRHAQRLRGLRFDDVDWLRRVVEKEMEVLSQFRPDLVINDYRDTIKIGVETLGIPLVGITQSSGNPNGYAFGWWITPPSDLTLPDCRESFNKVREQYGLQPIHDEREMFSGNISVIPGIKETAPLINPDRNSHHVGLLSGWWKAKTEFDPIPFNIPKIYSYIGEPSRPQYGYEAILTNVATILRDVGFYIAGNPEKYDSSDLDEAKRSRRVIIKRFIDASPAIQESSLVISHGGDGTVLLALSLGVPVVCVGPFTSEQSTFFKWVEKQGAGILIVHSEKDLERRRAPDLGQDVEIMGHWTSEINADRIATAINEVLTNSKYKESAERLGKCINKLGGASDVIDLALKLI